LYLFLSLAGALYTRFDIFTDTSMKQPTSILQELGVQKSAIKGEELDPA
jgi:hypothetical protein